MNVHDHIKGQDCSPTCPSWEIAERKRKSGQKQDLAAHEPVDLTTDQDYMDTGVLYSDED